MKKKLLYTKISWCIILALLLSVMPVDCIRAEKNYTEKIEVEEAFNYLYINESELGEGEEQNIVLSFEKGTLEIQEIELIVKSENDSEQFVACTANKGGVFLFQKAFEKGLYYVEGFKIVVDGVERVYTMEELGVSACFGVDTECIEDKKSEHIDMESVAVDSTDIKTRVVTLDKSGIATFSADISSAIDEGEKNKDNKEKSVQENIVVVLDPGHDSTHTGASGNGVKEHVATLKIAKYCKEELETYGGVTVFMTRSTADCPFPDSEDNIDDIKQRVKWASEKGADVYVSIHLNAAESSSAKGAEVYYHSESTEGKEISQQVQDELVEIGLYDRDIKSNDNYVVTKTAQSYGFPGIIIEHAFLSNSSDAENYLTSNDGLKELGVADATGIAEYYELSKAGVTTMMSEAVYTVSNATDNGNVLAVVEDDEKIEMNNPEELIAQQFELVSAGDKYYYIRSMQSGKVISATNGTVQLEEMTKENGIQKWMFITAGGNWYNLQSENGLYLTYSDGIFSVSELNGEETQKWKFERASYRAIEDLMPELVSVTNSNENVVLKWKELTGAEGYYVYRKTEDTKWKKIATIKSEITVSYKDTSAPAATKCVYTVKAYKGDSVSLYDKTGLSIITPAEKTYVKYKITTKVNYRTGPGTTYEKAGSLREGTIVWVEEGYAEEANGYTWYKIKLDDNIFYVEADYLEKVADLSAPVLVSAKYSNGVVTLKWESVAKAQGYYVYRKLSGESWSKIATVKSVDTTTYKDKSVSTGKTYIYTVRAYSGSEKSGYDKAGISVKIPAKETLIKYKTKTKVNYRSGAGLNYEVKGTLAKGTVVNVVKGSSKTVDNLKWFKIKISGKYYYVAAKYLKKVS